MPLQRTALVFAALVLYLTLFYQLGNLPFIGADEARYARIAEEMNLRNSYLTPTLNFRPWLEKPPLLFWLQAGSFAVWGVSEWSARLPVALLALLTILGTGLFTARLAGPRAGLLAALVLATSGLFFVFARAGSMDMPLTAALAGALFCAFLAAESRVPLWGCGSGACLALAVLAKGPVAALLFGGIFLLYFLLLGNCGWSWKQMVPGLAVFLLGAVPWYWKAWEENGYDFVVTFWLNHHLARLLTDIHHHSQPFWYYLPVIAVGFFPWVFFLGSAAGALWRDASRLTGPEHRHRLFLWLWVALPLIFYSWSSSKLAGYVLPVFPALAVMVALEWERFLAPDLTVFRAMKSQLAALAAVGVALALVLFFGFHFVYGSLAVGALLALPLAASAAWVWHEYRSRRALPIFLALVAGMTLFSALAFWRAAPILGSYHSARHLSLLSLPWISGENPLILYRYFHHTARYYTGYRTTEEAIPNLASLQKYLAARPHSPAYILTQEPGWNDLQAAFPAQLIRQEGNLYLVRIPSGRQDLRGI